MDLAGGGGGAAAAAAAGGGGGMLPQMPMEVLQAMGMGMLPPSDLPFGNSAALIKKEEVEGVDGNTATKQAGKSSKARGDLFGALGGSDGTVPNPMTLQTLAAHGYGATTMHPEMFKLLMAQQQAAAVAAAAAAAAAGRGDQQQQQQQEEEKAGDEKAFQPNLGRLQ